MTNKELTSVAIKVFSIYVLVQAILSVPYLANALVTHGGFFENQRSSNFILGLLGITAFALLVLLAIFLWKLANKIVDKSTAPVNADENSKIDASLLVSLLGLYLTFDGLLRLGYVCVSAFAQTQDGGELALQTKAYIAGYIIQVSIGLTLVLKSEGWLRFMRWLQRAGLKDKV